MSPTIPGTPVDPVSVPGRVGRPVVVAGDGQLEVSWSPPDDGGSAVTNYALWYRPRGGTQWVRHSSRATSPHTIGGLTNGVTYDVAVRAGNSEGWGPWSASASGTPVAGAGDGEVEVRVAFRRLGDGRIELGLQQRLGNGTWGEIQLPRARRLPAGSPVGDWQVTSPLVLSVGEVRVVARRVEVGVRFEVEYALQQRLADKSWGMRRLPRDRVFHNNVDVWRFASPVPLKKPGVGEAPVVVVAGQGTAVTAGDRHSCGLGSDGTIGCWGDNSSGQTDAPDGRFGAVSAGFLHTCGLRTGGAIECWGENSEGEAEPPDGRFSAVSTRGRTSCGLRTNGTIACWGNNSAGQTDAPAGRFSAASAGRSHACGLRTDGTITCWGHIASEYGDAPDGRFGAVAAGGTHSCGLRTNGTIECWGGNDHGQADAPDGHFAAVAAGTWHSCGLRSDGTIACWGANNRGRKAPGGQFVAITAGHYHSCALRGDGTIACWGADRFGKSWGQIDVPAELAGDYPQIAPIGVPTVTLKPEGRSLLTSYIDDPDAVLLWDPVTGAAGYDIDWRYMTIDSRRLRQIFRDLSSSRADVDALTDEAAQLIDGYEEDPRSIRGDSRLDSGGGIEARCRIAASSGECFNFVTGRIDGFDVDDPSYRIHSAQEDKVLQVRVRAIGSSGTTGSWSTWAFHPSSRLNAGCRAVDAYNEIRDIKTAIDVANAVLTVGSLIAAIVTAGGSTVATQGGRIIALEVLKQAAKALIKNVTMKRFLLNLAKGLAIKTVELPVLDTCWIRVRLYQTWSRLEARRRPRPRGKDFRRARRKCANESRRGQSHPELGARCDLVALAANSRSTTRTREEPRAGASWIRRLYRGLSLGMNRPGFLGGSGMPRVSWPGCLTFGHVDRREVIVPRGPVHRSVHGSGHGDRCQHKHQPAEVPACQARRWSCTNARRSSARWLRIRRRVGPRSTVGWVDTRRRWPGKWAAAAMSATGRHRRSTAPRRATANSTRSSAPPTATP